MGIIILASALSIPAFAVTAGGFLQSITDADGAGGSFGFAAHVATNSDNQIFVADNGNNLIQKFSPAGVFLSNIVTGLNSPDDVVIDSNGRIIVADTGSHTVKIHSSTGSLVTTIGTTDDNSVDDNTHFNNPHAAAVDSSNNIYVVDRGNDKIKIYDSDGNHIKTIDGTTEGGTAFEQPVGIAVDSNGRILISDNDPDGTDDNVQIFSSSFVFIQKITDADGAGGSFADPHKLAVDSTDRIYVGDGSNNRIQIFDSAGTFLQSITVASPTAPTTFGFIAGLTVDSTGKILVADGDNGRIQIFKGLGSEVAEGGSESVTVPDDGGTASFQYSETEQTETQTVSLDVVLPSDTSGTVTVATAVEDDLESGTDLATAVDITAPCTNTCTISFTVVNSILTELGLDPDTTNIYHDSDGDGLIEVGEDITTTRDTTTISGSTIFTGSASFVSKFAVGGVKSLALAVAGISAVGQTLGLIDVNKCDPDGLGSGISLKVYKISFDVCEAHRVWVEAYTTCGPMRLEITTKGQIAQGGISSDQPKLDEKIHILDGPIPLDAKTFSIIVKDKRDYTRNTFSPFTCTGEIDFVNPTQWSSQNMTSNQPESENSEETDDGFGIKVVENKIPTWLRNNAMWWSKDMIGDKAFVQGIEFLIKEKIMQIPKTSQSEDADVTQDIPTWVKSNAGWWAEGLMSDQEFVNAIQFLVKEGIIRI